MKIQDGASPTIKEQGFSFKRKPMKIQIINLCGKAETAESFFTTFVCITGLL
jgi:hypothetical protein